MIEHMNSEHLHIERISALLDEPWSDLVAEEHLESCEDCRAEFERLSRMRMAFSALGELDPPRGQWERIDATLDEILGPDGGVRDIVPISSGRSIGRRLMVNGPLQAAAALALFAGGIFAGLQFTGGGPAGSSESSTGSPGDLPSVISASGDDRAVYNTLAELESLRAPLRQVGLDGSDGDAVQFDPYEAARAAAQIDGMIQALQERLDQVPNDPFASGYLIRAMDARARLAEAIERSHVSRVVEW